jgi:pyridoxamine 5'-phosphate oxidase family protein
MTNSIFSQKEIEYLKSQRLARIATAAVSTQDERTVQPDVVPVGFDFDGEYLYVGGMNLLKSTKYRNVLKNNKVALVIDDLKSIDPCDPRGMKIYGTADIVGTDYQEFYKILSLLKDIFPWVFMSQLARK